MTPVFFSLLLQVIAVPSILLSSSHSGWKSRVEVSAAKELRRAGCFQRPRRGLRGGGQQTSLRYAAVAHLARPRRQGSGALLTPEQWGEFLQGARTQAEATLQEGLGAARDGLDQLRRDVDATMAAAAAAVAVPVRRAQGELEGRLRALRRSSSDLSKGEDAASPRYRDELALLETRATEAMLRSGWAEAARRDGIVVWKQYLPKGEYGHQYPYVKAQGIVGAAPEEVRDLLVESERIREYNAYSVGRTDVAKLGPHTKIVWNRAQPPLSSKLHDFCTLMHVKPADDGGGYMLLTAATEHPQAPLLKGHVRSEIVLGVTVLRPAPGGRTQVTTLNHIVSNGVPVMIADRVSAKNAADFIVNVDRSFEKARQGSAANARKASAGG